MKLAELNTRFFMEKFDLIVSSEGLEKYTEEERRLLYADFRLGHRRAPARLSWTLFQSKVAH